MVIHLMSFYRIYIIHKKILWELGMSDVPVIRFLCFREKDEIYGSVSGRINANQELIIV